MGEEQWKKLPDWPYEVSSKGRVRRCEPGAGTYEGRIRQPTPARKGYQKIELSRDGEQKHFLVHHLVLRLFDRSRKPGEQTNHLNGDKTDNRIENLEWVTASENVRHGHRTGLYDFRGENHPRSKLTGNEVVEIRERHRDEDITRRELADDYGISKKHVTALATGRVWKHADGPIKGEDYDE